MRMYRKFLLPLLLTASMNAAELSANKGELLIEENFENSDSKAFTKSIGQWTIANGVLKGTEVASDNHPAAGRLNQATQDAIFEFKFRTTGTAKSFNCGFDPAKGELDKKGHLWSLSVTPTSWSISKAPDKAKPKEDPAKVLAKEDRSFDLSQWQTVKIICLGDKVSVTIGDATLNAEHETFHVKKPTLIFRCKGDSIEVDEVKIWEIKK
jgi:hypothetical protein